jgi:hypothetical protein
MGFGVGRSVASASGLRGERARHCLSQSNAVDEIVLAHPSPLLNETRCMRSVCITAA